MSDGETPSQTIGPFFAYGLTPEQYGYALTSIASGELCTSDTAGDHIRIEGRVFDGTGSSVPDAMIELWQADAAGSYPQANAPSNSGFRGFGRLGTGTDPEHRFCFQTIKPGCVDAQQAPHINVIVFMRGLLNHVNTRIYFSDEAERNAQDPVLKEVASARRHTLIADRSSDVSGVVYRFDIHMQGPDETVFFDL